MAMLGGGCNYCQLDLFTGDHMCNCVTIAGQMASMMGQGMQAFQFSIQNCDCLGCPYVYMLNGGLGGGMGMGPFGLGGSPLLNSNFQL